MSKTAFMVMPFADNVATQAYEHCTKPVCEQHDLIIRRADELFTTNPIWQDIVDEINLASVIIVDITGRNPNVMYELGMAHTLKPRQTVMVTSDAHGDAPFDISHFRIIQYINSIQGVTSFQQQLAKTLDTILQDFSLMYKDEFILVEQVAAASEKTDFLGLIIGLKNSTKTVLINDRLAIGIENPKPPPNCGKDIFHTCAGARDPAATLQRLAYVDIIGEQLVVTDKGRAFASFLESQGWICHQLNEQIFTPGYANPFDDGKTEWETWRKQLRPNSIPPPPA